MLGLGARLIKNKNFSSPRSESKAKKVPTRSKTSRMYSFIHTHSINDRSNQIIVFHQNDKMASIESTWDLRCDSSPRSVAVGVAPSLPPSSSSKSAQGPGSVSGPTSNYLNMKHQQSRASSSSSSAAAAAAASTNPFDAVIDSSTETATTTGMSSSANMRTRNTNPFSDEYTSSYSQTQAQIQSPSLPLSSGYSVLIGTERGTIHHRTFPASESQYQNRNAFASSDSIVQPHGLDGTSSDRVHPLHRPLDYNISMDGEHHNKSPIAVCVRATASVDRHGNDTGTGNGTGTGTTAITSSPEATSGTDRCSTYLLLQHDKRKSSKSPFTSDTNTRTDEETGIYAANLISIHHITNSVTTVYPSNQLPRMSCATYHPNCGFVYAAGSSICSLPSRAVRAVSSSVNGNSNPIANAETSSSVAVDSGTNRPTIYYNATDILPSTARSGMDSISPACNGRVIVVAVGNAFYAVSGSAVPHGTWYTKEEEERMDEAKEDLELDGLGHSHLGFSLGVEEEEGDGEEGVDVNKGHDLEKVMKFRQSSQVHPAIVVEVPMVEYGDGLEERHVRTSRVFMDTGADDEAFTSLLFLASGRECAVVEILYNPRLYSNSSHKRPSAIDEPENRMLLPSPSVSCGSIIVGSPRRGIATIASPILAAVGIQSTSRRTGPLLAILTSDGLVHTRSPSCITIPLSTIEVGTRPNDYFSLRSLPNKKVVAISYGGEGRLISFREDTVQDLANRMMKLSIDAFGSNGFPRSELAEAVEAKFSATSYVGPEPTNGATLILRLYLETILGLDIHGDFAGGDATSWFFEDDVEREGRQSHADYKGFRQASRSPHASTFISATAVLCLLCTRLTPANPSLANRAAKSCASKLGVVSSLKESEINQSSVQLCKNIVEDLLISSKAGSSCPSTGEFSTSDTHTTPTRSGGSIKMEFVEAAIWLLRSCGEHEHAISIQQNILSNPTMRNTSSASNNSTKAMSASQRRGDWSQLKYESFMATHLGDLWSQGDDACRELVLTSLATRQLLEANPMLGLGVFTASHPRNEEEWLSIDSHEDIVTSPKSPKQVLELLKNIRPLVPHDKPSRVVESNISFQDDNKSQLPLESGMALAVTYLESLIGVSTNKPPTKETPEETNHGATEIHNELALLLLEGVLAERSDDEAEGDSSLGSIYRSKLRRLLGWCNASVSPDILMSALPTSFLRERALLLGQLGRHEDALRIFYCQLKSLDLALEYCDARFEKQQAHHRAAPAKRSSTADRRNISKIGVMECPYLPLVAVALKTDDSERGISAAIRVLSLRRESIDRTAALQLLPKQVPISALSKTFLIPALIDSSSQARRMTVVNSLLRAKYLALKKSLIENQIKSQSSLYTVQGLKSLNLGEPVYSSKALKARPSSSATSHFPDISIIKYFFPRYVVIQTMVTNSAIGLEGKTLGDVQLIVAESSDDALIPSINIAIKTLPPKVTGSAWCVLAASSQRLDGTATLTCEFRYRVLEVDNATGVPLNFSSGFGRNNRSFVEEIQDIEIRRAEFEG